MVSSFNYSIVTHKILKIQLNKNDLNKGLKVFEFSEKNKAFYTIHEHKTWHVVSFAQVCVGNIECQENGRWIQELILL